VFVTRYFHEPRHPHSWTIRTFHDQRRGKKERKGEERRLGRRGNGETGEIRSSRGSTSRETNPTIPWNDRISHFRDWNKFSIRLLGIHRLCRDKEDQFPTSAWRKVNPSPSDFTFSLFTRKVKHKSDPNRLSIKRRPEFWTISKVSNPYPFNRKG